MATGQDCRRPNISQEIKPSIASCGAFALADEKVLSIGQTNLRPQADSKYPQIDRVDLQPDLMQENAELRQLLAQLTFEKQLLESAYSQMATLAEMDFLTKLPNRRA